MRNFPTKKAYQPFDWAISFRISLWTSKIPTVALNFNEYNSTKTFRRTSIPCKYFQSMSNNNATITKYRFYVFNPHSTRWKSYIILQKSSINITIITIKLNTSYEPHIVIVNTITRLKTNYSFIYGCHFQVTTPCIRRISISMGTISLLCVCLEFDTKYTYTLYDTNLLQKNDKHYTLSAIYLQYYYY